MGSTNKNEEREVKFEILNNVSVAKIQKLFTSLNLLYVGTEEQTDVYWDTEDCQIINLKRGLRARYLQNNLNAVEFKSLFKKKTGEFMVEEIKLLHDGFDIGKLAYILNDRLEIGIKGNKAVGGAVKAVENLLKEMGLRPAVTFKKTRIVYRSNDASVEVCLDVVEGLNLFIEIECLKADVVAYEEMIIKISSMSRIKLQQIRCGYLDLLLQKNPKILSKSEFEDMFNLDYRWNVKPREAKYVSELLGETVSAG